MEAPLSETFGQRVRRLRKARRMRQEDVALSCGATGSAVGQWERMEQFPTVENLVGLAEALGATADELIWGDDMGGSITARLRSIPKLLRDGLVMKLHTEIDQVEALAKRLPPELGGPTIANDRLAGWSAKNKLKSRARKGKGSKLSSGGST